MGISLKNSQYAEPFNGTTLTITGLTATRVPYISTGGLFVDSSAFTFTTGTGNLAATTFNELTLTKATTGFTVAGGTTSKTLTVAGTTTLNGGTIYKLAAYSAADSIGELVAVGGTGTILTGVSGGLPVWTTATYPATTTAYKLLASTGTSVVGELAAVGATGEYLAGATGAIPAWATLNQAAVAGLTTASSPSFAGLTLTGDATVGSTTTGQNVTVNATETERSPAPTAADWDSTEWTCGVDTGGWIVTNSTKIEKTASTGTQTATPSGTFSVTAGTKYLVTAVVSAASGTTTWTLGGTTIPSFTAAATYSYVVTAGTTAKLIFSGVAASTCTITSVSVKEITTTTGNATVENDLTPGRVLARMGSAGYPAYSFANDTDTGIYTTSANSISITLGGTAWGSISSSGFAISSSSQGINLFDTWLYRDGAANTLALRNSTSQQTFNIYNTYAAGNYEAMQLTGVAGASVNITAITAGTGGDNLDIVLTPAGTGRLKDVSSQITAGTGTGLTVNDAGHLGKATYVVTVTYAGFSSASSLTADHTIATLPAKTRLIAVYADVTTPFTGGTVSAATLTVGKSAGGVEYLAVCDVKTGAVTKGLADADMGTEMTRAAQIQGSAIVNWTGTTTVSARITTVTDTTDHLAAGSVTFYLVTCRL